ncbi:MAG: hypothetical protein COS68_05560 [Elusimicrobia bacterium CG06_land_8_20_14_3_00_38_11]|nr:MAG: hypothetical protein COS68_05560 [Elusimicrobia bacterium CG06_land_8_20_14_3_00_38_11]
MENKLFGQKLKIVNLGLKSFADSVKSLGADVVQVDFSPPAGGNQELIKALSKLNTEDVDRANKIAFEKMTNAQPVLVDIAPAKDVIKGMTKETILHAGPPISWNKMCGPVRGAIIGALIYEGLAKDELEAEGIAASGKIKFAPCHHYGAVGPMAGIISASMYVFVVKNETGGNLAYSTLNEGLGKVLRFGANSSDVIARLKWMETVLAPALSKAVKIAGGINIKSLTAQALMMGDECHNRNVAATGLFLKEIFPYLLKTDLDKNTISEVIKFISGNPHFFLNLSMAACKATCDTINGLKNSTVVSAIARNGTELGIRVAGLGEKWFTVPAGNPKGLYFAGFSEKDANPDLGDSTISETAGIGANAMAAAPAIVKFVGGSPSDALNATRKMYKITVGRHTGYQIPQLDFVGTPVCFDIRKIVETQITPIINTGIAHKKPGIGQVGAGILDAPLKCFEDALLEMSKN